MSILKIGKTVSSDVIFEGHRLETFKGDQGTLKLATPIKTQPVVDISWLPLAAQAYQVSPNIKDYVFVEVPIVTADFPNRNMDCFALKELLRYDVTLGRPVYQTFIGKPAHKDHENKDPLKAKGILFDAHMVPLTIRGKSYHKVKVLSGWDRTKDPKLVQQILDRVRTAYSMGALVNETTCTYCKKVSKAGVIKCHKKGDIIKGILVYETCEGTRFIEMSSVLDPADIDALDGGIKI